MLISRIYDNLGEFLEPGKVTIIFGPRQVGKTTLVKNYIKHAQIKSKFVIGDNLLTSNTLSVPNLSVLSDFVQGVELLVIDEAQMIPNIGKSLKLLVDTHPNLRIIATGSSSFELAGQVGEPLVGRKRTLMLYPLSQFEYLQKENQNPHDLREKLSEFLIFGSMPAVAVEPEKEKKKEMLLEYISSFLLKDILALENIKGSKVLFDLLKLLAFQIGSEVSLSELGKQLGLDYKTVARYLDILEKGFIIYNLRGYSGNLRKEITKKSKYFFWDIGIRNAIISNFNLPENRNDLGQLWENFLVMERLKYQNYKPLRANNYFWRTWERQEVDWVEEREGNLFAYEFKYVNNISKSKKHFLKIYPQANFEVVNQENYLKFIG
jgi:predicted AAA+ superfamily ATPase